MFETEFGVKPNIFEPNNFNEILDNEANPFLENIIINKKVVLKRFKKGEVVIPDEVSISKEESLKLTIENDDLKEKGLEIAKRQVKQQANFILIYNEPMLNYKSLSEASLKMIFLIFEQRLALGSDFVLLSIPYCCTELNLSRPTITKGFVELVRNRIICKREGNVWWINPNYFYAGNRLKILTK